MPKETEKGSLEGGNFSVDDWSIAADSLCAISSLWGAAMLMVKVCVRGAQEMSSGLGIPIQSMILNA